MPMYEYECEDCGHSADKLRKLEDRDAPITCSECESKMIRVTSIPASETIAGHRILTHNAVL